jgi:predicted PolB exonuclease-like 3'-5' exonuclease
MTPILVFDIETVPDVEGIRRAHDVPSQVGDADVLAWYGNFRRAATGGEFPPLYLHRVVAVGCVLRESAALTVWSLGEENDPEPELIRRFFDGIERYTPQLVSWNGGAFDLPVLQYRALIHGVGAARYWDWGDDDRDFRYNNYLARFHTRHLDLMDVLAMYQPRAYAGLDVMARLAGFPGKLGIGGGAVAAAVAAGRLAEVRNYCECDVMNTYLLYLRFRLMRGEVDPAEYARELALVRERITGLNAPHWRTFLNAWDRAADRLERGQVGACPAG